MKVARIVRCWILYVPGILNMLDRNKRIKRAPEKFQQNNDIFDVIFTVEERVYDQVVEGGSFCRDINTLFYADENSCQLTPAALFALLQSMIDFINQNFEYKHSIHIVVFRSRATGRKMYTRMFVKMLL